MSHVNAIRELAITCLNPLQEFADKIETNYGSIIGPRTRSHSLRQAGREISWAVFAIDESAKFRTFIAAKVTSIGLLLAVFHSEHLSRVEDDC